MANFASAKQDLSNDISDLTKKIEMFNKKQINTEKDLERLEQYGRRENLEIRSILFTQNEKTNKIVEKVANVLKVKLEDKNFSISPRIFNDNKLSSRFGRFKACNNKHLPITVRFTNRDKRNEIFLNRLNNNAVGPNTRKPTTISIPSNFTVRENLTSFRKYLLNEAQKIQRSLNYKFVWAWQGQIFIRKKDNSRAIKISTLRDLNKLKCPPLGNRFSNY